MAAITKQGIRKLQELYIQSGDVAFVAQKENIPYLVVYQHTRLLQRGFKSTAQYRNYLAKKRGFKSGYEYQRYITGRNRRKTENKELSDLINQRLGELGKTQKWLAEGIGVIKPTVSLYAAGREFPSDSILDRLFVELKLDFKILDYLLTIKYGRP